MKLSKKKIPRHVAIIMDGNRRWARKQGLTAVAGHDYVAEKMIEPLVDRCIELGISYLTLWAFSTENWQRNRREVQGMIQIFRKGLKRSAEKLFKKGVRLQILGDIEKFPDDIAIKAKEWVEKTQDNKRITVSFALNYGGHDEIVRAVRRLIAAKVLHNSQVTEKELEKYLDTAEMPDPDLVIRTGGEQRLSGFMSWQSAYSELYFTRVLMPEFTVERFDEAISDFQERSRRFGR